MKTAQATITKDMTLGQAVAAIQYAWPATRCRISYPENNVVTIEENEKGIQRCDIGFTIACLYRQS
jgi:hypothetical protein